VHHIVSGLQILLEFNTLKTRIIGLTSWGFVQKSLRWLVTSGVLVLHCWPRAFLTSKKILWSFFLPVLVGSSLLLGACSMAGYGPKDVGSGRENPDKFLVTFSMRL
jgi:hypothetical protein